MAFVPVADTERGLPETAMSQAALNEFALRQAHLSRSMREADMANQTLAHLYAFLDAPEYANNPVIEIFKDLIEDALEQGVSPARQYLDNPGQYDLSGLDDLPATGGDFDRAFEIVVQAEGGYVDHPNDPGGETYMGITRRDHPEIWERFGDEFRAQDPSEDALNAVKSIYKDQYWDAVPGIENMNAAQGLVAFDAAVNQGPGYMRRMISETGGDVEAMLEHRLERYDEVIARNPRLAVFEEGWANRIDNLRVDIQEMVAGDTPPEMGAHFAAAHDNTETPSTSQPDITGPTPPQGTHTLG